MATFQSFERAVSLPSPSSRNARGVNTQLTAILDALLDARRGRAALDFEEFALVDGLLFGRASGEADFRFYLGPRAALVESIDRLVSTRILSSRERAYLLAKIARIPNITQEFAHGEELDDEH